MRARIITLVALFATSSGVIGSPARADTAGPEREDFRKGPPTPSGPAFSETKATGPGGQVVLKSGADEWRPVVTTGFLLWTANSTTHPDHYDVYAKPFGRPKYKVNVTGTEGWLGDADGTRVVYQSRRSGQSDIKFFDLSTRARNNPPAGVNTRAWEWQPSVSGDWLLFNREVGGYRGTWMIILFNLATGEKRVLDSIKHTGSWFLKAMQVNGNYAVWYRGRFTPGGDSDVYVYDIDAKTKTKVTDATWEYTPSVSSDGTVYFQRWNGKSTLWQYKVSHSSTKAILHLAPDYEVSTTYPFTKSGDTYLYYDPFKRADDPEEGDIYRVKVNS